MKRIISILLTAGLIMATFAVPAFAQKYADASEYAGKEDNLW